MYITIHYKTVFQNFQGPPMIFQNFQVLKCIKPKFTNFPGFQGGVRTLVREKTTRETITIEKNYKRNESNDYKRNDCNKKDYNRKNYKRNDYKKNDCNRKDYNRKDYKKNNYTA